MIDRKPKRLGQCVISEKEKGKIVIEKYLTAKTICAAPKIYKVQEKLGKKKSKIFFCRENDETFSVFQRSKEKFPA